MKLKKTLLCTALLASVSSAAMAGFGGFYIGPQVSYTWINTGVQVSPDNVLSTSDRYFASTPDGFTVGPHLGWSYQKGSWVYGLEGAYSGGSFTNVGQTSVASAHITFDTKVSQIFSITPTLGYALDKWLMYGKAGYVSGKIEIDSTANALGSQMSLSDSQRQDGWTAGAGVAYQWNGKQSVGFEYDYSRLGSTDFTTTTTGPLALQEQITVQPVNINTVSLIYTYSFG